MTTHSTARIPLVRPHSLKVYESSLLRMPGGVNSPVRCFPHLDQTPLIVESGKADIITDCDGYQYIDFCGSWGALICGHAHPIIVKRTQEQMALGSTFGIATRGELELAEKVCQAYPSVEKIRFVSSGTEATMSAIRLARGFTGRSKIIKFSGCYHGHADFLLAQAGSGLATLKLAAATSAGVPDSYLQDTLILPYNDIEVVCKALQANKIAAVILEPVAANMGVVLPERSFLEALRKQTRAQGALLIFDEVITGFRAARGGAQELYGIWPDLTCFGKIIGGGFPAAAFGGSAEIMDFIAPLGPVYQAGTLSGNPVAMAAGLAALELLDVPGTYEALQEKTDRITKPVSAFLDKRGINACIQQCGSFFTLFFGRRYVNNFEETKQLDLSKFRAFFHFLFERGIYVAPSQYEANFISLAHTDEHLDYTCNVILEFFA